MVVEVKNLESTDYKRTLNFNDQ